MTAKSDTRLGMSKLLHFSLLLRRSILWIVDGIHWIVLLHVVTKHGVLVVVLVLDAAGSELRLCKGRWNCKERKQIVPKRTKNAIFILIPKLIPVLDFISIIISTA